MRGKESRYGGSNRDREIEGSGGELGHWCFFLVCSYVGHLFLLHGCGAFDILGQLAHSDASDDVLSSRRLYRGTAAQNTA